MYKKSAFTIIELLITVGILTILTTIAVVNLSNTRRNSRDAARRGAVQDYSAAMNLYKATNGNYFVTDTTTGSCAVTTASVQVAGANNAPITFDMTGTGAGCVGYNGSSEGYMTRVVNGSSNAKYTSTSIAQALTDDGFLSSVQSDPLIHDYTTDTVNTYQDYLLTLCQISTSSSTNSYQATSNTNAQAFAVYAFLENYSLLSAADQETPKHLCGGFQTPGGWNIYYQP